MTELLFARDFIGKLLERNDDDWIDRMSYRYTCAVLITFCVFVTTKTYAGDPITCWTPTHFTSSHHKFTESYCWVKNTYYTPFEEYIPKENENENRHVIPYYQWVPIILMCQAFLFYLPILVWRALNNHTGIDVNAIVETAEKIQSSDDSEDPKNKTKMLTFLARQMHRYLGIRTNLGRQRQSIFSKLCGRQKGNYLVALYFCIKLLFLSNVIGQLFLLDNFLNTNYSMHGFYVLKAMILGEDWDASLSFPRVTMCDFKIRRLGNVHRYTVQCVLPINLFSENIYLFIWFWFVYLAALTTFGLIMWILRVSSSLDRYRYVEKHLIFAGIYTRDNQGNYRAVNKEILRFVQKYLRQDGVFVFRLVAHNTNAVTLTAFVASVWYYYQEKEKEKKIEEQKRLEEQKKLKEQKKQKEDSARARNRIPSAPTEESINSSTEGPSTESDVLLTSKPKSP